MELFRTSNHLCIWWFFVMKKNEGKDTKHLLVSSIIAMLTVPAFADNEPTLIPANEPGCNENVLNTTTGPASLEAIYTPNTITTQWYTGYGENNVYSSPTTCRYNDTINLPQTNPSRPGYAFNGWKLRTCTVPNANLIINGTNSYGHGSDNCNVCDSNGDCEIINCSTVSDLSLNEWKTEFSYGVVRGIASCQSTIPSDMAYLRANLDSALGGEIDQSTFLSEYTALAGAEKGVIAQQMLNAYAQEDETTFGVLLFQLSSLPGNTNYTTSDTGQYCFCKATHYTANNAQQCSLSSPIWVSVLDNFHSSAGCAESCPVYCADLVNEISYFRVVLFGAN